MVNGDTVWIWRRNINAAGEEIKPTEVCFRIQALIRNIDPIVAFKCLKDPDIRKSWDLKMADLKLIEEDDSEQKKYYVIKSNLPFVSDRDVVVRQQSRENFPKEGSYVYAFTSCDHSDYPESEDFIRTSNHFTGYKFSPAPEMKGTWMEWIQNIDVNGGIPGFVFKYAGEKMQLKTFMQMKGGFLKEQKRKEEKSPRWIKMLYGDNENEDLNQ
mmetsp:Transcript_1832/g.3207  ORF Transcript_1832/g.3207 Transcript_1832/m.3207 type:complete len:213 (-) Transcript_1832:99-737(-)|eukprot:CAMPEP_0168619568 /NCGR_PEP_ID=MMETSP0449_2-20121227/6669_1 /TAXON_ID=1082188 /ORGANISM="Strombidium rassoulzadegani, Strain ras09" /LENGTH=212 /DNA_ID=CAMNT_0008660507 /DNA_START=51 /DNA_END=689 /DNA_ORIENTATION=-